jgi:N-acetylmuramoyl-L-alanine amidase
MKEHEFNKSVGLKFIALAKKYGIETMEVSPDPNYDMSLNDRINKINTDYKSFMAKDKTNKAIMLSIHANAFGDGKFNDASGIEVFYLNESNGSKELAQTVYSEIIKGVAQKNRGVKTAQFAMLKCTPQSALIEFGLMTNEFECGL